MSVWDETWLVDSCDRIVVVTGPDPDHGDRSDIGEFRSEDRAALAAIAPEAVRLLLEIEWSGLQYGDSEPSCPSCTHYMPTHDDECELEALLRKAGVR